MIIITDTSAFASLTHSPPQPNINLTTTHINSIPASGIINSTITSEVKIMLNSIVSNTNVSLAAKSKIAAYAGFSTNTNVTPNTVYFNTANVSLDKLTFYIIFRLPFTNTALTYEDIGIGLTSSSLTAKPTSWGMYANYIRSLSGSGIKKINSSGVDFDLADDYFTTKDGYLSIGALLNTDGYTEYETNLFDNSNNNFKIPPSFFRLTQDENAYITTYKNKQYRRPHWPVEVSNDHKIDKVVKRIYYEREIIGNRINVVGSTETVIGPVVITDFSNLYREYISVETNGNYFISSGGKHYHFSLKDSLDTDFTLTGAEVLFYHGTTDTEVKASHSGPFRLIARKPDPEKDTNGNALETGINLNTRVYNDTRKYLIEMYKDVDKYNGSGLTFGVGIDIGGAFTKSYQRKITYRINFLNSVTNYKLGLARKVSSNISYSTDMTTVLKNAVIELLKGHLIDSTGQGYQRLLECNYNSTTKQSNPVTITKINNLEYLININAPPAFLNPNDIYSRTTDVTILNLTLSNPEREVFIEAWSKIKKIFLKSFNITIPTFANTSLENDWLNNNMQCYELAGITNSSDQLKLQNIIKGLFGVRGGMCWVQFRNNFHLIRKFQFGLAQYYVYHIRTVYNDFYLESYYNKAMNTLKGGINGTEIKVKLNEVEKYLLASIQYNQGSINKWNKLLRVVVNSHDIAKLKEIANSVAWGDDNRSSRINNFINSSKSKLYHDVE